jgi:1-pyrroline-4-hydroxy-2-carboxylate deaminase
MARFPGVYVAVITPFTDAGEVDYPRLREHVDWLIGEGVHGLVPTGSCGEYAALTETERGRVVEEIVKTTAGRVPVVVGTAAPSTAKAVAWARHAKESGAAGLMALPPINYRPTRAEVVAWYRALAEVGLPIIAYNNPFDTSTDLTPDLIGEIARIKEVVGVKEFSGDVRRIPHILAETRLEVLAGADDLALESVLVGATGWIAGLTNVVPRDSVRLFDLAREGRIAEARELYGRLLPLFRYDSQPIFVQVIKHCLAKAGKPAGQTRAPRLPLDEGTRTRVEAAYALAVGR